MNEKILITNNSFRACLHADNDLRKNALLTERDFYFAGLTVSRVLSSKTAINLRTPSPTRFGGYPVPPLSIAEQALTRVLLRIGFTASLCCHKSG